MAGRRWAGTYHQSVLKAAKREASSVSSLALLRRSPCILPAALKTRSTPAEDAGAAQYCLTILARLGHFVSLTCHALEHGRLHTPAPGRNSPRPPGGRYTRIKPSVKSPKSGILVTEVITFDKIAPWVILGRS